MDFQHVEADLAKTLITEDELRAKLDELARRIEADYEGKDLLLVGVLRGAASVEICTMLRKPDALKVEVDVKYCGFDIPNEFVIGYGLDYAEQYRNMRGIGVLAPHVYSDAK